MRARDRDPTRALLGAEMPIREIYPAALLREIQIRRPAAVSDGKRDRAATWIWPIRLPLTHKRYGTPFAIQSLVDEAKIAKLIPATA
jgi:hypothetical protein